MGWLSNWLCPPCKFNQGDVVKLKTGDGPKMVVAELDIPGYCHCVYWDNGHCIKMSFSEDALVACELAKG